MKEAEESVSIAEEQKMLIIPDHDVSWGTSRAGAVYSVFPRRCLAFLLQK